MYRKFSGRVVSSLAAGLLLVAMALPSDASTLATDWGQQRVDYPNPELYSAFGQVVAVDGDHAMVAAPYAQVGEDYSYGDVEAYSFEGGVWTHTQTVAADEGAAGAQFGAGIAISGNIAVVGAPRAIVNGFPAHGAVYVFEYIDGAWQQTARVLADVATPNSGFGTAVALDGDRLLVGAPQMSTPTAQYSGVVFVFQRNGSDWEQVAELAPDDVDANAQLGGAIALSGSIAVIGSPKATIGTEAQQGAVYVFEDSGSGWSQVDKITASNGAAYNWFGDSVSIDGERIAVGAPRLPVDGQNFVGGAYVFDRDGSQWMQSPVLIPDDADYNYGTGTAVALDGDRLVVTAPQATADGISYVGAAYVFEFEGAAWTQQGKLFAADRAEGVATQFGVSAAVSGDRIAIGAPNAQNTNGEAVGAAYLYVPEDEIGYLVVPEVVAGVGAFDPDSPQVVPNGGTLDFAILPAAGYHLDSIGGDCPGSLDDNTFTVGPVVANCRLEAAFAIDDASQATVVSGNGQATMVNSSFAENLVARFTNEAGLPVPNVPVDIIAPAVGAGAAIVSSAVTDANGEISLSAVANSVAGTYEISAETGTVAVPAVFSLTNLADTAAHLRLIDGDGQSTSAGKVFPKALTVQLLDDWNNPIEGATVHFSAPTGGATASLSPADATTDAAGIARSIATASTEIGSYQVQAASGSLNPIGFSLSNTESDVSLSVSVDNGVDRAAYGATLNYLVTLGNTGSEDASGVNVDTTLPPQLDAASARWICLYASSGNCTAEGDGPLQDNGVVVPAHGSTIYLLSVAVRPDASGDEVQLDVLVSGPSPVGSLAAADVDQLVLFDDGFERTGLLSAGSTMREASLQPGETHAFTMVAPIPGDTTVQTILAARNGLFRLERLDANGVLLARLVAVTPGRTEQTSAWLAIPDGSTFALELVDGNGEGGPTVQLLAAAGKVELSLASLEPVKAVHQLGDGAE